MTVRGRRTQPLLTMAIQITHKHERGTDILSTDILKLARFFSKHINQTRITKFVHILPKLSIISKLRAGFHCSPNINGIANDTIHRLRPSFIACVLHSSHASFIHRLRIPFIACVLSINNAF